MITGTQEQIQKATQLITDMVNRAVAGGGDGGGPGGGMGGGFRKVCDSLACHISALISDGPFTFRVVKRMCFTCMCRQRKLVWS